MNTEPGPGQKPPEIDIFQPRTVNPVDQSAAALEALYQAEQDKRREERFFWIAAVTFLLDIVVLRELAWPIALLLMLFQIAILLSLAKWLGLESVAVPIEQLYNRYLERGKPGRPGKARKSDSRNGT